MNWDYTTGLPSARSDVDTVAQSARDYAARDAGVVLGPPDETLHLCGLRSSGPWPCAACGAVLRRAMERGGWRT